MVVGGLCSREDKMGASVDFFRGWEDYKMDLEISMENSGWA